MRTATQVVVPSASMERRIRSVRGRRVILDSDLAELYGVQTFRMNEVVKRNPNRFPDDFMIRLSREEFDSLTSQTAMSKGGRGGRRTLPFAFTEHGVAMLSSVLNSERAIEINLMVIRAFIRMRELVAANKEIATRVDKLERSHKRAASVIEVLVEDIGKLEKDVRQMQALPAPKKRRIGFSA